MILQEADGSGRKLLGRRIQEMLFNGKRKKKADEFLQRVEEAFSNHAKSMADMEERLSGQFLEAREESRKLLRRQSGSLEDIMEELQRQGEEKEAGERQFQELKKREAALVELCCLLAGQKEMILRHLLEDGALPEEAQASWRKQACLMDQETGELEKQCAFQRTGVRGERVDYDFHEVLSVCPTRKEEDDGTVAQVFSRGCLYQGSILKRAQVAAYKFTEKESADTRGGVEKHL